jgi:hypothetical protein
MFPSLSWFRCVYCFIWKLAQHFNISYEEFLFTVRAGKPFTVRWTEKALDEWWARWFSSTRVSLLASTREDFMAPVDGCHCITHYPLLVWTVFGGMHIQTACSTEIQFEVTNNLTTSVAWCVCDFMFNSSGAVSLLLSQRQPDKATLLI